MPTGYPTDPNVPQYKVTGAKQKAKRKPRKAIDTAEYRDAHGRNPRGRGSWGFRPASNACDCPDCRKDQFWTPGGTTYTQAVSSLPAGDWVLLP